MPIAFVSSISTTAASSTSAATASFTAPADSFIVAYVGTETARTFTISNTGTARTWTKRADNPGAGASNPTSQVWTASNLTSQSITVTALASGSGNFGLVVYVFTGVDTTNPIVHTFANFQTGTTTAWPSLLWTTTIGGTWAVGGFANYNATANTFSDTSTPFTVGSSVSGGGVRKAAASSIGSVVCTITPATSAAVSGAFVALRAIGQDVAPSGIASLEAWGTASLGLNLAVSSIASLEAFGTTSLVQSITFSGIASLEAWGTSIVDASLRPLGIPSAEAWGAASVIPNQFVTLPSLASEEAWGTASLAIGYPLDIALEGIVSEEAFGDGLAMELLSHYVLRNPSIQETPAALTRPFNRFGIHRGISIIKRVDGSYYSSRYPAQTELEEAEAFYLGGRLHPISPTVWAELVAAGYGAYITLAENEQ